MVEFKAAVGLGTVVETGVGENEDDAAFCAAARGATNARALISELAMAPVKLLEMKLVRSKRVAKG